MRLYTRVGVRVNSKVKVDLFEESLKWPEMFSIGSPSSWTSHVKKSQESSDRVHSTQAQSLKYVLMK